MSTHLLRETGEALYGPQWQSTLSHSLGVSDRTMRRWASGATEPPCSIWADLMKLTVERVQTLRRLSERLNGAA
jgi:hypothetical protein